MSDALRYAKVIVDVPAKATDRAFDYIIPAQWEPVIEIGSRVGVPFGPRVLQGFVVDIHDQTDVDASKLKPIEQVLDIVPPLTPELVRLGKWMSETYLCPEVIALQAMIPGALKAKYERIISVPSHADDSALETLDMYDRAVYTYVAEKGQITPEALLEAYPDSAAALKRLVKAGALLEVQTVKDRLRVKRVLTVYPPEDRAQVPIWLECLPASARRQKEVLAYLAEQDEPIALTELCATLGVSNGAVKALAEKGWISIREKEVLRDPYAGRSFARTNPLPLTAEQRAVLVPIQDALTSRSFARFLLHGVTGSGKTEVYLQAIERCLEQGREAIVLVPEISLTPQMVDRFKGRFGDQVAVLHSRLSNGERYDEWRKIQRRQVSVAVGARSAIFAPFANLGLIIIDEEHESSYKQEESPKYMAKDTATERAKQHDAVVVLGSATPSLESYEQATAGSGELRLLAMPSRVGGQAMPKVHIIDMREELKGGNRTMFSRSLHQAIKERLARKEQIVLLLNRRGYATFVLCRSCGYTASCPHCEIALTYHQKIRMLRCHYCGYAEKESASCPSCGSEHIRHFGTGTQRVEEELNKHFPGIRVIRMDVDTTGEKGAHEKWLTMFRDKEADVLLGTQMVAKGLDFPDVTLVGVIAADSVLHLPDFRAVEKTFQLVTQVAGRAGRHQLPGEVIVQTYNPDHYSMQAAAVHDYRGFAEQELEHRRQLGYPPYSRLVLITFSHEEQTLLMKTGDAAARAVRDIWLRYARKHGLDHRDLDVLGPVPSPIPKLKDRYRFQCMVKYRGKLPVSEIIRYALQSVEETADKHKLTISVDVDPQNMM